MDRRLVSWLLLTTGLFLLWINLRPLFVPNQPDLAADRQTESAEVSSADEFANGPAEPESDATPDLNSEGNDVDTTDTNSTTSENEDASEVEKNYPLLFHTLGSLNPKSNYALHVTTTSQGGAIEHVELVARKANGKYKYRSLDRHGYLGHLALTEKTDGLGIQIVPGYTPASTAANQTNPAAPGLAVNDVIVALNGIPTKTKSDWSKELLKTKPGQDIELDVLRGTSQLKFTVSLTEAPLDVIRQGSTDNSPEEVAGNLPRLSCLTTIANIDGVELALFEDSIKGLEKTITGNWDYSELPVENGMGVEYSLPLGPLLKKIGVDAKIELVKRYTLGPSETDDAGFRPFDFEFETIIRNYDDKPHRISLRQEGFNGLTLEGWWYSQKISQQLLNAAGTRDIVCNTTNDGHVLYTRNSIYKNAKQTPNAPFALFIEEGSLTSGNEVKYMGVDTPYFAALFVGDAASPLRKVRRAAYVAHADVGKLNPKKALATNVGFWFETPSGQIPAASKQGDEIEPSETPQNYSLFVGPKSPEILAAYDAEPTIEYGWFGVVSRPLSHILHFFYGISRNYGIAIIMLTVLVRGLMFPLGRKAAMSAQYMQLMAPELKSINEKHKDDWEARTAATQAVYKKYKFNPLAGCLPMFIQLPIFLGLYRALSVDIELRQQSLIPGLQWCSNLASPDMFANWSSWMPEFIAGRGTGWLGPYFNLLPLVTVALFYAQQKVLMPKPTDEQQAMTQKLMSYMTLFMGVLFFKVPAGLCIYFISSSLWSIVERQLVKRSMPSLDKIREKADKNTSTTNSTRTDPKTTPPKKSKSSERPEKLSDVLPWLKKPATTDAPENQRPNKGPNTSKGNRRKPPKRKNKR